MTMNKILVIGNLGRDPEMRYTPSGQAVTNFTVATNRKYTAADGESKEETEWFRVSAAVAEEEAAPWGRLAETCNQYLAKGRKVYVEGRLRSRSYETRDGQTRFENEIVANDVRFIGTPAGRGDEFPQEVEQDAESGMGVDDLPF
jgi:single-strand DNA-binding protein